MIGKPGRGHLPPRAVFLAHHANHFRRGPDERDVRGLADLGEVGVFGEEAVAGMDGVHVGDFGGADDVRECSGSFPCERGGPMQTASSANRTCSELRSASE